MAAPQFQFHKGTIKTWGAAIGAGAGLIFQFHKGTIKTAYQHRHGPNLTDFNSIKVRLKLL